MKEKIKQLFKSSFLKNVLVMASGAAGAQVITLLLTPIITRQYGPEAFGVMGTFTAAMNIVGPIAALTYPIAIVLPENDNNAKKLAHLSLIITIVTSILALVIILILGEHIVAILNWQCISFYLYLIPLIMMFTGVKQILEQWLIRTKRFAINARATLYQSLIINSSKTTFGFITPYASVLVILTALNNGVKALVMYLYARKSFTFNLNGETAEKDNKSMKELIKSYIDFPIYRAPETFLNMASEGVPTLMLSVFFGPAYAGFYSIGKTTLSLPERLIGQAIGDVFYPRITEAVNNKEDAGEIIKKTTLLVTALGLFPFGLVILFGPYIFSFIFGNEWVVAGEYARWIALWSYTRFMNRPSIRALPAFNALRFNLIYTIIMIIVNLSAFISGYCIFSSDIAAVTLFGVTGAVLNLGVIIFTINFSKNNETTN